MTRSTRQSVAWIAGVLLARFAFGATSPNIQWSAQGLRIEASVVEPDVFRLDVAPGADAGPRPADAPSELDSGAGRLHWVRETGEIQIHIDGAPSAAAARWTGSIAAINSYGRARVPGLDITWKATPGERIYGLGERFDTLDQAGKRVEMWIKDVPGAGGENADSYFCTPVLFSSCGYALFAADNPDGEFDLNKSQDGWNHYLRAGPKATFYVALGNGLKELVIRRGRVQGPFRGIPDWAWGPWISRNSFETQSQAEDAIRGHVARGWPVAAIVQEAWKGPPETGDFNNFFPQRWPDVDAYFDLCRRHDIRTVLWQVPVVHPGSPGYSEAHQESRLVRTSDGVPSLRTEWFAGWADVDFTNPEASAWWTAQMDDELQRGVSGVKADDGESIVPEDVFSDGRRGWEMHNAYAALYNLALTDYLAAKSPETMLWARSGSLGIERTPALWAGDQFATWEQLRTLLPAGLSTSLSGMPFWSHDIGGYAGTPTPELYIRWLQLGAFSPLMQYHGITAREPWLFGADAEAAYDKLVHIRMCLKPTWIELGKEAAATGLPIMRPVEMEFPSCVWHDQYMLGANILMAPVLEPGATGRIVHFPPGKWRHLIDPVVYDGSTDHAVLIGSDGVPAFVRVGAQLSVTGEVASNGWRWRHDASVQPLAYSADAALLNLGVPLVADALRGETFVTFASADSSERFSAMCTRPGDLESWQPVPVQRVGDRWSVALRGSEEGLSGKPQGFRIWRGEGASGTPLYTGCIRWGSPLSLRTRVARGLTVSSGRRDIGINLINTTDLPVSMRGEVQLPPGCVAVDCDPPAGELPAVSSIGWRCSVDFAETDEAASRVVSVKMWSADRVLGEKKIAFSPPWRWVAAGPFVAARRAAHRIYFGPECEHGPDVIFDAPEGARWEQLPMSQVLDHSGINFRDTFGPQLRAAAYAMTRLNADRDCDAEVRIGSDDTFAFWLNDELVANREVYRAGAPDQDVVPVRLRRGSNVLVFKVAQDVGGWELFARLTGPGDTPLLGVHDGFDDYEAYRQDRPPAARHVPAARAPEWLVAGPFPRDSASNGLTPVIAAMGGQDPWPPRDVEWRAWSPPAGSDGTVDLAGMLGQHCHKTAWVALEIQASSVTPVEIVTGADDGLRLWLNGELLVDADRPQQFQYDAYRARGELRAGPNRLLACVSQECGDWTFRAELMDLAKQPPRPLVLEKVAR